MKKTLILTAAVLFSALTLNANSGGTDIFKAKCQACHMLKPPMDRQKMMQMSPGERRAMKQKIMHTMKAPPMSKVSAKLKHDFGGDREKIIAFVKDYIVNPSEEKAHCMPMALQRFGTMPPIGRTLTASELDTVSAWIVDGFTSTWDADDRNMACNAGGKNKAKRKGMMKCGPGKCGGAMKCGPGKCGGK